MAGMSGFKVGLGLRRRTSYRDGLTMDGVVVEGSAGGHGDNTSTTTPRKQSFKSNIQVPNVKLKKFRKYDTFIWLREPQKDGVCGIGGAGLGGAAAGGFINPDKPLNRLRSLNSM